MARGVRKTTRQKLEEQLTEVEESICQYKNCLETLEERAETIKEALEQESLRDLSAMLKENNLSPEEAMQLLNSSMEEAQGA